MIVAESSVSSDATQRVGESASTSHAITNSTDNATSPSLPNPAPATAIPATAPNPLATSSTLSTPHNASSSASARAAPPAAGPAPSTPSSPNRRRAQRPLSSVSFFLPFSGQQASADGPQVGLTWTLEVFGNGEDGGAAQGPDEMLNGQAGADTPTAGAEHPPHRPEATADANAAAGPEPNAGPNPQPDQQREGPTRSIFFIVGPDGTMRRGDGAVDDAATPLFPFPFPFAFPFQPGPPPPDPAKAAELLNSLPTVGRALLKRVDKVVAAEGQRDDGDNSGWQCGICLEGSDVGETVKALPCNHLFHESCLQPWFTNHHHNCPTCRLDLDPLRTLHEPARREPLRPATTGSGRGTPAARAPHPYARRGPTGGANSDGPRTRPGSNAATQPGTPQNERVDGAGGDRLQVPVMPMNPMDMAFDIARMLGLPVSSPIPMREDEQRREEDEGEGVRADQGQGGPAAGPSDPTEHTAAEQSQRPAHDGLQRPTPERRRHITVFHIGGNGGNREETNAPDAAAGPPPQSEGAADAEGAPANASEERATAPAREDAPAWAPGLFGLNPLAGAAVDWSSFMNGGGMRPNMSGNGATVAADPAPANPEPQAGPPPTGPARPPAGGAPAPPANPSVAGSAGPNRAEGIPNAETGTFRLPFEFLFVRPPPPEEPVQPENQTPVPLFVPQSLESWTAQREKGLGWRCDAIECLIAPPVPDAESMDVDVDDDEAEDADACDKEMLAIHAETQPPFQARQNGAAEPHTGHGFVLLACPHRWHRACLETAARSAGHSTVPDASGREWIRCARCRKEGWIVPREPRPEPEAVPLT